MDGREIILRCRLLAQQSEVPCYTTRTYLSPPMHEVHRLVRGWMEAAGLRTRVDAVGNLRGVYGEGPRLMIGSHLDTVPHAGAFDGILGVIIAIALVQQGPPCSVEVAAWDGSLGEDQGGILDEDRIREFLEGRQDRHLDPGGAEGGDIGVVFRRDAFMGRIAPVAGAQALADRAGRRADDGPVETVCGGGRYESGP